VIIIFRDRPVLYRNGNNQEKGLLSFAVIAGTFGDRENAQKRWRQLQNANCETASIICSEGGLFVVEAKYFTDRKKTEAYGKKLEEKEGISTYKSKKITCHLLALI
jgi:hypothetical protein